MTITAVTTRWPSLATPPAGLRASIRTSVARRLFQAAVNRLDVSVDLHEPDGARRIGRGGPLATVHEPEQFFARLGRDGLIGFGEAYLTEAWDSDDLVAFLTVLAAEMGTLIPPSLQRLRGLALRRMPRNHRNTRAGARRNITHHYDLSNDLFALFLDPSMTYSSALFESDVSGDDARQMAGRPRRFDGPGALRSGQERKIDRLLDAAGVGPGTRLLEIGTGWGELAIRAALRGAVVRSVTLSAEQKALADRRIAAAGLADHVTVDLCDYRDVVGSYDAIVSVEMIEAVGWQYWTTYFERLDALLADGGRVAIQAITMPHDRMLASRGTHTWITKYIFPGGALPSVRVIDEITRRRTSLQLVGRLDFGLHYAATLRFWDESFNAASEEVRNLGFDDTFQRMWHFYLAYCEAGFAAGYIDVNQLTFVKEAA